MAERAAVQRVAVKGGDMAQESKMIELLGEIAERLGFIEEALAEIIKLLKRKK